jgi:DNA primase catalytic subunit
MDMKLYEEKAKEWLRRASDIHFEIEKLYISAMDFDKKEAFTADFIKEIKKCLCLDKK